MKKNIYLSFLVLFCSLVFTSYISTEKSSYLSNEPIKILWKFDIGQNASLPVPLFDKGTIYIGNNTGSLYAIESNKGKKKWEFKAEGAIYSKPCILNDRLYLTSYEGFLYALFAPSSTLNWKVKLGAELNFTPVINKNQVVVCYRKMMYGYELETGLDLWKKECITFDYNDYSIFGNQIYFYDNQKIIALTSAGGGKLWEYKQNAVGMSEIDVVNGLLYYSNTDGVTAINVKNGQKKWEYKFESKSQSIIFPKVIVNEGVAYIYNGNLLFALGAESGTLLWNFKSKIEIKNFLIVGRKFCYTDDNSNIYLVERTTHKKAEMYNLEGKIFSKLYTDGTNLYFISSDGQFCAFQLPAEEKK
jgi:outer membrane protein assembly factor BamB